MSVNDDRHSHLKSVPPPANLTPDEEAKQAYKNALKQYDCVRNFIREGIDAYQAGRFRLKPSMLLELDRSAVEGLVSGAGAYRRGPIEIGKSKHVPPDAELVPKLVDELCDYVNDNWDREPLHLSAYVMWRLNWIHPFEDGNGRTSRAASYVVLCVRSRCEWPGSPTIPELISVNKPPYYKALEAADAAWESGRLDVSAMEKLLEAALLEQILSVTSATKSERASTGTKAGSDRASRTSRNPVSKAKPHDEKAAEHRRWLIGTVVTITLGLMAIGATMVSSEAGQKFLGLSGESIADGTAGSSAEPAMEPPTSGRVTIVPDARLDERPGVPIGDLKRIAANAREEISRCLPAGLPAGIKELMVGVRVAPEGLVADTAVNVTQGTAKLSTTLEACLRAAPRVVTYPAVKSESRVRYIIK